MGRPPGQWGPPRLTLADITLPRKLPVTLPSELVRRRPDILAAEAQLHSASAKIGVATAAMYPNITLSAGLGQNLTDITNLLGEAGQFWNFGAALAQPIFQGGTLRYKRRAAWKPTRPPWPITSRSSSPPSNRWPTPPGGGKRRPDPQGPNRGLEGRHPGPAPGEGHHQAGMVNYFQILNADNQYQQAKLGYIQAQALRLQDTAALFVALGGGWWSPGAKIAMGP